MDITEEQRKRAEANHLAALNRLAALAKRKAILGSSELQQQQQRRLPQDSWKLFKCRKLSSEQPPISSAESVPKALSPENFLVRLEVCSPDSFSVTPEAVQGLAYPGEEECLRGLTNCLSDVMPSHYTQNHGGRKACVYKLRDYNSVLRCLKTWKSIDVEEIPWATLNVIERLSHSFMAGRWIPCRPEHLSDEKVDELVGKLPKMLVDTLLPFQLEGVRFGLQRGGRCLIADEMGLGKTLQAIAIAGCFMNEGSILVVCPAVLRYSWAEELEHWLPFCLPADIHLVFGHRDNPAYAKTCPRVVVISYKMLCHLRKSMLEQEWAFLIVDESHHVRCSKKESEPEEIKAVLDMAMKVKRIVLLSGTPSLSRPYDIFHQIHILWPGLLGTNKYEFAKTYCAVKVVKSSQGKFFQVVKRYNTVRLTLFLGDGVSHFVDSFSENDFSKGIRLEELNVLLTQTVMIRRLKEHVLTQLPPKRRQIIRLLLKRSDIISAKAAIRVVNGDASKKGVADDMNSQNLDEYKDCGDFCRSGKLSYEELGIAKLSGFREWLCIHPLVAESDSTEVLDLHSSSHKMIIFAHHHKVLDGIQEFVCEKGISFVRIDGNTLPRDRQSAVMSFKSSTEVKVAIIGITAGGVGLDFSSAQNVVFLELPRSPSLMLQAEDRAHRRGQTTAVNIYIFCAKGTLDESNWSYLNRSLRHVSSITNGKYGAIQEIQVDGVSYLETCDKIDRSCKTQITEKSASSKFSRGMNKLPDSGLAKNLQPFDASAEVVTEKNGRFERPCSSSGGSLTQKDDLCASAHAVSGEVIAKTPASSQILEGNDSEAEIRSADKTSPCKLNEDSEDNHRLQKELTLHPPMIDVNGPVQRIESDENGSADKISPCKLNEGSVDNHRIQKELTLHPQMIDANGPVQQIESDESYFDQVDSLRFEVSQYTERIHLYSCIPGTDSRPRPLFENFRPEELESLNSPVEEDGKGAIVKSFKDNPTYRHILVAFVNEWSRLRPIDRRKLLGKPLQLPLTVELCCLSESINHNNGGLLKGGSKRRKTPLYEISQPLPSNAEWKKVNLCKGYGKKEKEYMQGWTDEPLCKLCQAPCKGNNAKTPEYFEDLFCNLGCYEEFRIRTSNRSLRQELFQIEHGICSICQLDCHKLVKDIRPLSLSRRQEYIEKVAPNVARRRNFLDKLVNDPTEGNAWHADHIVPVYRGGGECRLENMRTLCVACHYDVTAAQCAERRLTRAKAKKQLKVIMHGLKHGQTTKETEDNVEDQGRSEKQNILEGELLVKVPGSAYSVGIATGTGNEILEEPEA